MEPFETGRARPLPGLSDNVRGSLWFLLATGLFAVAFAMAKEASVQFHVLQILFFRQLVIFVSTLPTMVRHFPQALKTERPGLHAIRLVGAFVALSSGIWAVSVLPLTTAITLTFAQVFFVTLLSALVLGEPVDRVRIGAVIGGFIGVLVVMRPGVAGFLDWFALVPLVGAFGAAVAVISVRQLSQSDRIATLLIYQAWFVGLVAGIALLWLWVTPDLEWLFYLLIMGVIATAAQWAGVRGLRMGEASVIGAMQYSQLIYAAALGYLMFGEVPDRYTLGGAVIIITSALVMMRWEMKTKAKTG